MLKTFTEGCPQPIENSFFEYRVALQAIEKTGRLGGFANCILAITLEIIQMWSYL
ncbi:hypothetical protein [Advenella sp. FME57]|uniref:hypothetical protein n=1 Tax=Advenella sp. FME57 TaxID=2742604 RepID=UPI001D009756|nr:hypothetical protein [Advenella sp. FME57]